MKILKVILKVLLFIVIGILIILIIDYARINIRYLFSKKDYEEAFNIYGNKNGLVPQGLTYSEKYNVVLQTSYSKESSMVYVIDFKSGKLIKELKLINKDGTNNIKHVGGITTDDNYVWISNDYEIDVYNIEDIVNASSSSVKSIKEIKLPIRGDFCYYHDDILWVGDFYLKPFYDVPNGDPKLNGYKIDTEINLDKPDYVLSLPKMVQGMSILPDGSFAFTESFTYLINSNLSIYENILDKSNKFDNSNLIKTIKIPPMAEGLFSKDGYLYLLFESSSDKYSLAEPKVDKVLKYKIK